MVRLESKNIFLVSDKKLKIFFYTSSMDKYLQASAIANRSGIEIDYFKSKQDPYEEDYSLDKLELLYLQEQT